MTLKQMKYFEAVCQTGSIAAAAEQLYISRSVVSRTIRDLEEEFDIPLFTRNHNSVELTESGKLVRNLFMQFGGVFDSLQSKINAMKLQTESRALTVGVAVSCSGKILLDLYEDFHRKHPDISLLVREMSSYDAYRALCDGTADAVITPLTLKEEHNSLNHFELYPTETVFITAKSNPLARKESISYADICNEPLGMLNSKPPLDWPLHIVLKTLQQDMIHQAVTKGIVSAILPRETTQDWKDAVILPMSPPMHNMVKLVWNEAMPASSALSDLLTYFRSLKKCE